MQLTKKNIRIIMMLFLPVDSLCSDSATKEFETIPPQGVL